MIQFGGADKKSLEEINSFHNGLFVSELLDNTNLRIHQVLAKQNFINGSSLFHGISEVDCQELRTVCNGKLDSISDKEIHGIMMFYVQRITNYAHINSMQQAQIKWARIIPSGVPRAGICKEYEGTLVDVEKAFTAIERFKTLTHEEYFKEISSNNPYFPPLYRECKCTLEGIIPGIDSIYDFYEKAKPIAREKTKWDWLNEFQIQAKNIKSENFWQVYDLGLKVSEMLRDYSYQRAKVERQIGEILLAQGDNAKALFHLEKAFEIDEKVGVKKLISKLNQ
jgi:tetratricopeptide (TPR) repeat protein